MQEQTKKDSLKHIVDGITASAGAWTTVEDKKLRHAIEMHGGQDWAAIAVLIPGRTNNIAVVDGINP